MRTVAPRVLCTLGSDQIRCIVSYSPSVTLEKDDHPIVFCIASVDDNGKDERATFVVLASRLTVARNLICRRTSTHVPVEPLTMRTTALIGYTIVETLDVRLTVGLAAIEIESIAVAGTRWNEIT